jgi:hypothetical protein
MNNRQIEGLILTGMEVYKNDVKLKYTTFDGAKVGGRKKDKPMTHLSKKSLSNLVFLVQNTDTEFRGMITLTYPSEYPSSGKEIKSHLNRFLSWMRSGHPMRYVWFLEFQKRGAPHFHILTEGDMSPHKYDVSEAWYRAVGSSDPKHLKAGTRTEKIRKQGGAANYAAKYGAKREQKEVPENFRDVGRFWGASRGVKPEAILSIEVHDIQVVKDTLEGAGWGYIDRLGGDVIMTTLYNAGKALNIVDDKPASV